MKNLYYLPLLLLVIISCKNDKDVSTDQAQVLKPVVFDGIDNAIKPGDDFYNHVNKKWSDNAVIADDQVGVGSYSFLNIPQQELLKNILEEVSKNEHKKGSIEQMVGDFYASGMDTVRINEQGYRPIQPLLDRIKAIDDVASITAYVATQIKSGDYSMFGPDISPDQENSAINMLHFSQTGLGLPDRDYYFGEDASVKRIQDAYKTYLTTLFELVGDADAKKKAAIVYNIEN